MTAQHQDFADLATEMIAEDGRMIGLVSRVNTGTDYKPVYVETVQNIKAVQSFYDIKQVDGNLIQKEDRKYLFDGVVPIDATMLIRDDGFDYTIVARPQVKPGSTTIMYKVQARL